MLIFCLCGCDAAVRQPDAEPSSAASAFGQADFDAYLREILPSLVDMSTFSAGFLFLDPQAAGLPEPGSAFGWTSEEDWEQYVEDARRIRGELKAFDPATLDAESRRTLALLLDFLDRQEPLADFYLLDANSLGLESGAATLSTEIAHAPYQSSADFDRLFAMYADLDESFHALTAAEQTRQESGAGMTRAEIDLVVEELQKLIAGDPPAAQSLADERIDEADFLSAAQKEEYHAKNAAAVADDLVPAVEYLIGALQDMPGRSGVPGMAGRQGGKEYYAALLRTLGFDETPEELMDYLEEQVDFYLNEISSLVMECEDMDALAAYAEDPDSVRYIEADTPEEILAYLEASAPLEFPEIDSGSVSVTFTPEALRAPAIVAYYILAPLDQAPDADKQVFVNDEQSGADYLTLAHEGIPGHLYQDVYAAAQGRSPVRRLAERSYLGATEGWGVYSEMVAAGWAQGDAVLAQIAALSSLTDRLVWAWSEIGVNYLGWTAAELDRQMEDTFGFSFGDDESYVDLLAAMPGSWVPYGAGAAKILGMRRRAETALGDSFDPVRFHAALLDELPASFAALDGAVERYIESGADAPGEERAA